MLLDTLLNSVTPQAFLAKYIDKCSDDSGNFKLGNTPITPFAGGFVTDIDNSFTACSVIEALAILKKQENTQEDWPSLYEKSITELLTSFKGTLPESLKEYVPIKTMVKEATRRRDIFNLCVCLGKAINQAPGSVATVIHKQFGGRLLKGVATFLSKELMARLADVSGCKFKKSRSAAIVIPYFKNVHTVAGADIIYSTQEQETVWFCPCRFAITGLPLARPNKIFMQEANPQKVVSDFYEQDGSAFYFAIRHANTGVDKPWMPSISYYIRRTDNILELIGPSLLQKAGVEIFITQGPDPELAKEGSRTPWEFCVTDELVKELHAAKEISPEVEIMLNTVKTSEVVRNMLIASLTEAGNTRIIEHLYAVMKGGAIWEEGGSCIYDTNNGYLWEDEKNKALGGAIISNFTVKPLQSTRYENGDVFIRLQVNIKGEEKEITINMSCLDTAKKFLDGIAGSVIMLPDPPVNVPSVYDTVRFRPVLVWLYRQIGSMPVTAGISYLGWNPTQEIFRGPGWVSSINGFKAKDMSYNPASCYLKSFNDKNLACSSALEIDKVNKSLATVIYQCFGLMLRFFNNRSINCPVYSDEKETKNNLKKLFSYIGQNKILQLNKNMRDTGANDCFHGYPVVATGYNKEQAFACNTGFILIGESDNTIKNVAPYEMEFAGNIFNNLLKLTPEELLKGEIAVELANGKPTVETLEEEGRQFLLALTQKIK